MSTLVVKYGSTAKNRSTSSAESATLLWSNNDRTASFSAQDVTLSQAVDSFRYLRVIYAYSTSSSEDSFREVMVPVWNSDRSAYMYQYVTGSTTGYRAALCLRNSEGTARARTFNVYSDGERMHFYGCQNIGSSTTSNTGCIPVYIYGIK
jgi:hypothetical protein